MTIKVTADKDELNFPHSPQVVEALQSLDPEIATRYRKNPKLINVLSEKHDIPKDQIFLEQGIMGIIHRVFDYRLTPDSQVLLPELGYPQYHKVADYNQASVQTFQFRDLGNKFAYDLDDLLEKLQQKPGILVLIDPESPLGFSIPNDELEQILSGTDPNTLVVLDQAHEGFREDHTKDVTKLVSEHPNLLVARGFSKFYGLAGVRVAYALCGDKAKEMISFRERYLGFDALAQHVAATVLQSEDHYKRNASKIREEKARFNKIVEQLPDYRVLETNSLSSVVVVPEEQSQFLAQQAKTVGISIRHLGDYHEKMEHFYRITMCPSDKMQRVADLFSSVSWLYDLQVHNSDVESVINTREAGYTIHRKEIPCQKSGVLMGLHRVIVPPGKNVPAHQHSEQDELFEFHSPAYFELNGERFEVQPGQWVNVKPGDQHYIEALPDRFARFIPLRFPYEHTDKFGQAGEQVIHEPK